MGSTRRRFTPEYKAEAVQFVISSGRPTAEVARSLGIVEATLGNWVAKARENGEAKEPVVMQVYCRVEVVVDDPTAVAELAVQRLRDADIDWSRERDTVEDAATELRTDLAQALASVVDPERMLDGVPGVEVRRGRWWAERGRPSARFQPGFSELGS